MSSLEQDFDSLTTTVLRVKHERDRLLEELNNLSKGFTPDPGTSDLDDEQPIYISTTLGDYRRIVRLLYEVQS